MLGVGDPIAGFAVVLRTEPRGPVVAHEQVKGRDIAEALSELSFAAGIRCSGEPLALSELEAQVRPVVRRNSDATTGQSERTCAGFSLEAQSPLGKPVACQFDRRVLEPVAWRASQRLIDAGKLAEGDMYFYELEVPECRIGPLEIESNVATPERRPIAPLLERAQQFSGSPEQGRADASYAQEQETGGGGSPPLRVVSQDAGEDTRKRVNANRDDAGSRYDVFYTRAAFEKAERISRKGGAATPPIETGGLLLGSLYWCDESRSLYCIVEDMLEASDSNGTTYSLTFTAKTWGRVQAVVRARQRQPATRNQRIVGVCHGHMFLPYSVGATCDGCPAQGDCRLSTAFLSESDQRWSRAVFPREPWQISHIFGLTPRRERVSAFFGQHGATLERRDYHVLDYSCDDS